MVQLHKKFSDNQIRDLLARYVEKKIKRVDIQKVLGIGKTRFFGIVKEYKKDPKAFSVEYVRANSTNKISPEVEKNIFDELEVEKKLIEDPETPVRSYNYSFIRDRIVNDYHQKVSLSTIISRANDMGYCIKKKKKKAHDREVATNYVGELIQHDSSHHKFSPYSNSKWFLITSLLDDYSRFILYARLVRKESSWAHIRALEAVCLRYGLAAATMLTAIPYSVLCREGIASGENTIVLQMR